MGRIFGRKVRCVPSAHCGCPPDGFRPQPGEKGGFGRPDGNDAIQVSITFNSFFAVKMDKMKNIHNFMLNHVLFYHFPEKTC